MVSSLLSLYAPPPSVLFLSTDQRLDLNKLSPNDSDTVRGQIVGEYRRARPTEEAFSVILYALTELVLLMEPLVCIHVLTTSPNSRKR